MKVVKKAPTFFLGISTLACLLNGCATIMHGTRESSRDLE